MDVRTYFRRICRLVTVISLLGIMLIIFSSCGIINHPHHPSHLSIISVSGSQFSASGLGVGTRSLDEPVWGRGHIDSGPPDYVKITLKSVILQGDFGDTDHALIWSSPNGTEVTISGSGNVDLSGLPDISNLPEGTVTSVKLTFDAFGKFCGHLSNAQFADGLTIPDLYTKSAYAYNAYAPPSGGSDNYIDFKTGPAEETSVAFNGGDGPDEVIETPVSYELVAGVTPKLTILIDISRMLRFYDGLSPDSGPNPSDLKNKAYFFCHSVIRNSIACFFGDPGSIQGYQVIYDVTQNVNSTVDIPAWMTLIYDPNGDIQSGILIGDDDNALTVAKGMITTSTTRVDGDYDFHYDISEVNVSGFHKVSTLEDYSEASWTQTINPDFAGTARFILKFQM